MGKAKKWVGSVRRESETREEGKIVHRPELKEKNGTLARTSWGWRSEFVLVENVRQRAKSHFLDMPSV
jgi:hypothetical protein